PSSTNKVSLELFAAASLLMICAETSSLPLEANKDTAEAALGVEEKKEGYALALLQIVASDNYPYNTRLSGALVFKNFIRFNYTVCLSWALWCKPFRSAKKVAL